ncbi:MAG: insulinase family protein [Fusobacteria bacterium]|nr:insulinase family protein [Fusobacteriota bacterium]
MPKMKTILNSIPVIYKKMEGLKSVSFGIYVKTGLRDEKNYKNGISHFLEHMLFKGTKKRTAKDISEEIDFLGGSMNAFTSAETTGYYVTSLGEHLENVIDVLSDMYINSEFLDKEIDREKGVIVEEIKMYEDIPEEKIFDYNSKFVLEGTNYEKTILGTEESVKSITRDNLIEYWNDRYTNDNMVIAIAGDFNIDKIILLLEEKFKDFHRKEKKGEYTKLFNINSGRKEITKTTNQVHLCVNTKGLSYHSEDRYKANMIINVLGGNMSSRLFQKIREEEGLAYSIYSYNSSYTDGGLITTYAGTTKKDFEKVISLIKEEYKKIYDFGITKEELQKAKNQHLASLVISGETTRAKMGTLAGNYLKKGKLFNIDEFTAIIKNINIEDVLLCSKDLFNEKYYSEVILGDI